MKALSLHGPWAYYERQNASNEARIVQLQGEVRILYRPAKLFASPTAAHACTVPAAGTQACAA